MERERKKCLFTKEKVLAVNCQCQRTGEKNILYNNGCLSWRYRVGVLPIIALKSDPVFECFVCRTHMLKSGWLKKYIILKHFNLGPKQCAEGMKGLLLVFSTTLKKLHPSSPSPLSRQRTSSPATAKGRPTSPSPAASPKPPSRRGSPSTPKARPKRARTPARVDHRTSSPVQLERVKEPHRPATPEERKGEYNSRFEINTFWLKEQESRLPCFQSANRSRN